MGPLGFDDPGGVEPVRMHTSRIQYGRARRPCNRQSPRQERSQGETSIAPGHGPQTGVPKRTQSPEANPIARGSVSQKGGSPDKNQSGRAVGRTGTWAGRFRDGSSPAAGANLRRALKNPMSATRRAEGRNHSPGQAAKARIGSGTPRLEQRTVHDRCRAAN
jgi:hypothetical protein